MDRGSVEVFIEAEERRLDRNESVKKLSSLKKESFSRKGKTHKDECNKQATQPNIQTTY